MTILSTRYLFASEAARSSIQNDIAGNTRRRTRAINVWILVGSHITGLFTNAYNSARILNWYFS